MRVVMLEYICPLEQSFKLYTLSDLIVDISDISSAFEVFYS